MGLQHLISIDREAKLSVDCGRIKIAFIQADECHFIAACDIAVLILAHPCISMSVAVYQILAQNGAVIVTAGKKYMPCALSLPIGINADGARRPFLQTKYLETDISGSWWAQLIEAKILGQAHCSVLFDKDLSERLRVISKYVENGDKSAREAQAAGVYWPPYFRSLNNPIDFRDKQGTSDPVNISLNYGYAVLRAIIARSLTAAGLCLNFGVGHRRKDNPFNLADDFIEPFRFLVDKIVWKIFSHEKFELFDKEVKKQLLGNLLSSEIAIAGKNYRLFQGIDFAVNSFCLSLEDPRRKLLLPSLPSRPGKGASAQLWNTVQFQNASE